MSYLSLNQEKTLNFIFLKEGKDPDDLINEKDRSEPVLKILKNKFNLLESLFLFYCDVKGLNSPERIINFKNIIYQKINSIKDLNMRELYKTFVNSRVNEISKNQIYKFSNVSKTLKKIVILQI